MRMGKFAAFLPIFINVTKIPTYLSSTTSKVDTNNLYWSSRIIGALADAHYQVTAIHIQRYQEAVATKGHQFIIEATKTDLKSIAELESLNEKIAKMAQDETDKCLNNVLYISSCNMKNGYARSDN